MGKEATFGLAVILVLLIALGVVLVRRFSGSAEAEPAAASSAEQDQQDPLESGGDPEAKHRKTKAPDAGPSNLSVVAAKPTTGQPPFPPSEVNRYTIASDRDETAPSTSSSVAQVPPRPMMPNPSLSAWDGPYDRGDNGLRQTSGPRARQLRSVSMATSTGGSEQFDPFPGSHAQQTATGDSPPARPLSGRLRSLGPPRPASGQSAIADHDYPSPGQYPLGGDPAGQTPDWRQSLQQTAATRQQAQTLAAPPVGSSLDPVYDAQDLRNENGDYKVQPNESYWVISQRLYGSGAYFKALAEHNRAKVPREDRLAVGEVISAPSVADLERAYPAFCPKPSRRQTVRNRASMVSMRTPHTGGRVYVVEEGDTIFDIARYELGKASRWVEILRLNRDLVGDDPDYINAGMRLVLPYDGPSERVTQQPRPVY